MLRKLFKHEFRYYNKYMLLSLLVMLVSLLLTRASVEMEEWISESNAADPVVGLVSTALATLILLTVMGCFAALMLPQVLAAIRFYKNLTGDEGYLSFTLPVKASHHVLCKTFVPFIWSIVSGCALIVMALLVFLPGNVGGGGSTSSAPPSQEETMALSTALLAVFGTIALILLNLLASIVQINFSISCGQLFRKHKLIGSIGCYIALNTVLRMVTGVVTVLPFILTLSSNMSENVSLLFTLFSGGAVYLIITIVLYVITCRIMTNKLNLE